MSNEFEPYNKKEDTGFNVWEYNLKKKEPEPVIVNEEEEFLKEREIALQEAIQQGYNEGLQKAQVEIDAKKEELVEWLKLVREPVQLLDDKLTQELIQTIIWLCVHCIGVEISVAPEKLRELFQHIKEELPSLQGNKMFAMHPDDIAWIKKEIGISEVPGLHDILVSDPLLGRGDFYLKSENSELDGRIQTRLITLFSKYISKDNLITPIESQD